jgi:hypothetical protein
MMVGILHMFMGVFFILCGRILSLIFSVGIFFMFSVGEFI